MHEGMMQSVVALVFRIKHGNVIAWKYSVHFVTSFLKNTHLKTVFTEHFWEQDINCIWLKFAASEKLKWIDKRKNIFF